MFPCAEVTVAVLAGDFAVPPASMVSVCPEVFGIAIRSVARAPVPTAGLMRTPITAPGVAVVELLGLAGVALCVDPATFGGTEVTWTMACTGLPGAGGPCVSRGGAGTDPGRPS